MAVLGRDKIIEEIKSGRVVIEPYNEAFVGPASIDLHLGNQFRTFKKAKEVYHVTDDVNFEEITDLREVKDNDFLVLMPGETVLGITREKITFPEDICGRFEGRSRFARIGLMVHITAGFLQPGINNKQVLEFSNVSPIPLALHPGTKICQIVLERMDGKGKYQGRFKDQQTP